MSRKGNCWDNAVVESSYSGLETELFYRHAWRTRAEAAATITEWIEVFYNPHRRHSTLGQVSPGNFEDFHRTNGWDFEELLSDVYTKIATSNLSDHPLDPTRARFSTYVVMAISRSS